MIYPTERLRREDIEEFQIITSFLNGRFQTLDVIEWALGLGRKDIVPRLAILESRRKQTEYQLKNPWLSAWHLIEESWEYQGISNHSSTDIYDIKRRLEAGDRSGSLISDLVASVSPHLSVQPHSIVAIEFQPPPKVPKSVQDILSISITSCDIVDPKLLSIGNIDDTAFLGSMAHALESVVLHGLDMARRIGWNGDPSLWQLGHIHRVYYVSENAQLGNAPDPDIYLHGIAPSVKLLYAVVKQLADLDLPKAIEIIRRWKITNNPIMVRLWAAISRDRRITNPTELGTWLEGLNDDIFWPIEYFPEIAELRAIRFADLPLTFQIKIASRIRKLPPRRHFLQRVGASKVQDARLYYSSLELKRIELSGAQLPKQTKRWFNNIIFRFPKLLSLEDSFEGYYKAPQAHWVAPDPYRGYDLLSGEARLKALESALSTPAKSWDEDASKRAWDWIRENKNSSEVLSDFESTSDAGASYPKVWERFGWGHRPQKSTDNTQIDLNSRSECDRVLTLLLRLSVPTTRAAINSITDWLLSWEDQIATLEQTLYVWQKLWPISFEYTENLLVTEKEEDSSTLAISPNEEEPRDIDTLNNPVGRLAWVFLAICSNPKYREAPFEDVLLRSIRDAMISTHGRSGLIARHRLIEDLTYFLSVDPEWTEEYLISPLRTETPEALVLWRAFSRRPHFFDVIKVLGTYMLSRALDTRLDRATRNSLAFYLVVECLNSFWEKRPPAVPYEQIQQMLRNLNDEVRVFALEGLIRYIRDMAIPKKDESPGPSSEELFRTVAIPFLQQVWPQERSLAKPGISEVLADLPASAKNEFVSAVDLIERFLVPFECWSMLDFGLFGDENGAPAISIIDTPAKAAALIRLLDLCIGTAEGAVVPFDLGRALDHVRRVSPNLIETPKFRRLATVARMG